MPAASSETESPLRVAHLTATYPPYMGGAGNVCASLARGLAARGHRVEVHTAPAPGAEPAEAPAVHRHRPLLAIGNAPLIPGLSRLRGYDVVHLHYPFIFGSELTLRALRRSPGTALVVSYHNRLIGERLRRPLFWAYEQTVAPAVVRAADRIATLSEAHARTVPYLRAAAERAPEKLVVLPNGVDAEAFSPGPATEGLRERLGIPGDALVAGFVATLDRAHFFKRLDLAIAAGAAAGVERLHLLVVGDGDWRERYEREAAQQLEGRVHFLGALDHGRLPGALRACDLLIMPSDLEAFPLVLLEAMACGLPVVATDLPGVRAVVDGHGPALLAPRGDAAALAARVRELAALPPAERRRMGARGREICEASYAWPRLVERTEQIYREAIASRSARRRAA